METERSYVKDLELAINCFLKPMRTASTSSPPSQKDFSSPSSLPSPLRGKEGIVFCNLEEILAFHKGTFLKELEKYETMPEDVGHCFVTWVRKATKNLNNFLYQFLLFFFICRLPSSTST